MNLVNDRGRGGRGELTCVGGGVKGGGRSSIYGETRGEGPVSRGSRREEGGAEGRGLSLRGGGGRRGEEEGGGKEEREEREEEDYCSALLYPNNHNKYLHKYFTKDFCFVFFARLTDSR